MINITKEFLEKVNITEKLSGIQITLRVQPILMAVPRSTGKIFAFTTKKLGIFFLFFGSAVTFLRDLIPLIHS